MPFNLVCPASRGLSLALSRRLLKASPYPLIATARKDIDGVRSKILEGLDVDENRVTVLEVDVTGLHTRFPQSRGTNLLIYNI